MGFEGKELETWRLGFRANGRGLRVYPKFLDPKLFHRGKEERGPVTKTIVAWRMEASETSQSEGAGLFKQQGDPV